MLLTDDWGTVFYSRKSTCPNQNLIWTPGKEETLCSFIGHQVEQWGFNSIWGPALPTLQFFLYVWWLIKWVYLKKNSPSNDYQLYLMTELEIYFFGIYWLLSLEQSLKYSRVNLQPVNLQFACCGKMGIFFYYRLVWIHVQTHIHIQRQFFRNSPSNHGWTRNKRAPGHRCATGPTTSST